MDSDWRIYCLISSIIYIEEVSKPIARIQIKRNGKKEYKCLVFQSTRLKMKGKEIIGKIFDITRNWEKKKKIRLIGESFKTTRTENLSGQEKFNFSPIWLNYVLSECGNIPNKSSFDAAVQRIKHFKHYKRIKINKNKNLFNLLLKDENLAAGAFIVSMDLECRGVQSGNVCLCMSEKYKDFLEFMLRVAQKWDWTNNECLSSVSVEYSKKLGINASPQYEFRINIKGLQNIYKLAGPLMDSHKDRCVRFNIQRSRNYTNLGWNLIKNKTKEKIIKAIRKNKDMTSTYLQFIAGVRTDVVLDHLHKLENKGIVEKKRRGKRYIWNIKNAS